LSHWSNIFYSFYFQRQRADEEAKKQAEIEALQKQLQSLKDMASGKQVTHTLLRLGLRDCSHSQGLSDMQQCPVKIGLVQ
jgi:hypothetical protein